jgi:hypothetical protein
MLHRAALCRGNYLNQLCLKVQQGQIPYHI